MHNNGYEAIECTSHFLINSFKPALCTSMFTYQKFSSLSLLVHAPADQWNRMKKQNWQDCVLRSPNVLVCAIACLYRRTNKTGTGSWKTLLHKAAIAQKPPQGTFKEDIFRRLTSCQTTFVLFLSQCHFSVTQCWQPTIFSHFYGSISATTDAAKCVASVYARTGLCECVNGPKRRPADEPEPHRACWHETHTSLWRQRSLSSPSDPVLICYNLYLAIF